MFDFRNKIRLTDLMNITWENPVFVKQNYYTYIFLGAKINKPSTTLTDYARSINTLKK